MYQTCLPQVFRHLNSVTDTESEILSLINGTRPPTTDQWETVHIESATGRWDNEKTILQYAGFNTVVTAEDIDRMRDLGEFDSSLGYFDERSLELFWQYVDNTRARVPKNRMYLGWMTTTTHSPFLVPEEWAEENRRSFVYDDDRWSSIDGWLNAVRWTDDKIKEIILGFRERSLENDTLFFMYLPLSF
jgi:phosphoglycerol transferase MdoB-like AlkP superfamily enzyme